MLDKIFKSKKKIKKEEIFSPLTGQLVPLEQVPDPVFSEKMMGDGVAVIPEEGVLVSPVEGEVVQVFHTKHAIGIKSVSGLDILLHIGLETVELNGEGFNVFIKEGQTVKVGDPLLNFDISFLRNENKEIITPIVITNYSDKVDEIVHVDQQAVSRGENLFVCRFR
ncbi:PTS glucose transporter subunit IIA [Bacillus sonorensis]|uniref:PTS system glucose subfamily transporter subunit IIA n=2 Tax=Bacillus sonorensis TaxID=119858 RepID=M5PC61_9BACI|nr:MULTISPECIES: PTS glucose transporter subunit IIA [Bacillus]TWK78716.1 PTS system glucose-specific EIIA component [Bacillus paralicheniformis]ASB91340.1 Protein-N(pi)-phosphohistidine--sugar phosphotransferase [Bacillus sonorensis]EME72622.1 PTS system glucose subfamily transporter subunit IIA [Bacillus sonorensis L12]MBG9917324.1 PTS glucose transporter subunit IIA [Bacillus sonorensis]MCY8027215.1 PTS glucose transporter subunit IIA [Bacillus sonorensis]